MEARLALRAEAGEITRLNFWLRDQQDQFKIRPEAFENMKLCLNEVAANIITHGYQDAREDVVYEVVLQDQGRDLSIAVIDDALPFDPTEVRSAQPITGLDDAQIGGFGLKLIREATDLMSYRHDGQRNRLNLLFLQALE